MAYVGPLKACLVTLKPEALIWNFVTLIYPDRVSRLILYRCLGIHWAAHAGRFDALQNPSPLEKKAQQEPENYSAVRRAARRLRIEV